MSEVFVSVARVQSVARNRKPGYVDEVMRVARVESEGRLAMSQADFARIRKQYAIPRREGPGTHLKKILGGFPFFIKSTSTCACNKRVIEMNNRGCDWCEANIDTIVGWLRDEAGKRGLPFLDAAGRMLVRRAIRNARRDAAN